VPQLPLQALSVAVLGLGAVLWAKTSRVSETTIDRRFGAGRIAAAIAVVATAAGVAATGVAVVLLVTG
jgi:hypothetical protein